jgi:membrane-associated phospholipid phosphatase
LSKSLVPLLVVAGLAGTARAQDPVASEVPAPKPRPHHRPLHITVTAVGGAMYVTSEAFLKKQLAPEECHWCDPPHLDVTFRDWAHWNNIDDANTASNVTGFILAPTATIGLVMLASSGAPGRGMRIVDDTLPIVESAVIAGLINQGTKFLVGRQRPFVHYGVDPSRLGETDDNVSFYSGHATLGFSLAVSAGMVAHQRGYKLEPVIWATGITLATTTAYLRMAADKHYLTDVMAGAATGTAIGIAVPLLFHGETLGDNMMIAATPNSLSIAGAF